MCVPHEVRKTFIQLLELLIIMSSVCEELVPANDVVRVQKFRFQQGLCLGKPHYQDIIQLQLFLFLKHFKSSLSFLNSAHACKTRETLFFIIVMATVFMSSTLLHSATLQLLLCSRKDWIRQLEDPEDSHPPLTMWSTWAGAVGNMSDAITGCDTHLLRGGHKSQSQ